MLISGLFFTILTDFIARRERHAHTILVNNKKGYILTQVGQGEDGVDDRYK